MNNFFFFATPPNAYVCEQIRQPRINKQKQCKKQ